MLVFVCLTHSGDEMLEIKKWKLTAHVHKYLGPHLSAVEKVLNKTPECFTLT